MRRRTQSRAAILVASFNAHMETHTQLYDVASDFTTMSDKYAVRRKGSTSLEEEQH